MNNTQKTVLVTGGSKGLGAAITRRFAQEGYRVGVLDLVLADCVAHIATLAGSGHVPLQADVTDEAAVHAAFEAFGVTPDVVVSNAGIVLIGPLLEQSVANFRRTIDINLTGTYIVNREAALRMVKRGSGSIVNMTSLNAVTPGPGSGAYPASKAGVAKLTEQFSLEVGTQGVRVNCVAPGFIDGGMSAPFYADPRVRALRGGAVPLRRLGTVEDIANAVYWLASDESSYVNGHQLVVDGGVAHSVLLQLPRSVD